MTEPSSDLLEQLYEALPRLTAQQKKAVVYILQNYKEAAFLSSTQLSAKTGVSGATLNRLCIQLGFSGYLEFQTALQGVIQNQLTALDRIGDTHKENTLGKIIADEIDSLTAVQRNLNLLPIDKAVEMIAQKDRLLIVGHQVSEPVAQYATYTFGKIRPKVERLDLSDLSITSRLEDLGEKDIALIFALPRYPIKTIHLLKELKARGVYILLVTYSHLSPYSKLADLTLPIPIKYYQFTDGLSPLICLVNGLVLAYFQANSEKCTQQLEHFEQLTQYLFVHE